MNIKLTKMQAECLYQELSDIINLPHIDMTDKLLVLLLSKLYKKLHVKLLEVKRIYQIKMDDEIALAMFVYYQTDSFDPTNYSDITLKNICNSIEKKYA